MSPVLDNLIEYKTGLLKKTLIEIKGSLMIFFENYFPQFSYSRSFLCGIRHSNPYALRLQQFNLLCHPELVSGPHKMSKNHADHLARGVLIR